MKEIMNLPSPKFNQHFYTAKEVLELCEAARSVALEEAAGVCISIAIAPSNCILGAAMNCADAIRSLK